MIVVAGFSHHTAPIAIRERFALDAEREEEVVGRLLKTGGAQEVFCVSTCNRVEVYACPAGNAPEDLERCQAAVVRTLSELGDELAGHLYVHQGTGAMRHWLRVASSLDSLVVGEPQILGQLKQGFERAVQRGSVGAKMHRLFARAVRGAKRVRSETEIGAGQVSVPSIAIELATQIFGDLRKHRAALIGAGEMGQTVGRLLADQGAELAVLGRDLEKVTPIAAALGGRGQLMDTLPQVLAWADIIVSSTSASAAVVSAKDIQTAHKARRGRNLFMIDLAVPRDIDPRAAELDGVFLYNVDDLSQVASSSEEGRKRAAQRASLLVDELVSEFERWLGGEQVTPVVKALRRKVQESFASELERSLKGKLRNLEPDEVRALEKLLDAAANRLLHAPTVQLRRWAASGEEMEAGDASRLLQELFELSELELSSSPRSELTDEGEAVSDPLPASRPEQEVTSQS